MYNILSKVGGQRYSSQTFFLYFPFIGFPIFQFKAILKSDLLSCFVFFCFLLVSLVTNADMRKLYKAFHSFRESCAKSDVTGMWS